MSDLKDVTAHYTSAIGADAPAISADVPTTSAGAPVTSADVPAISADAPAANTREVPSADAPAANARKAISADASAANARKAVDTLARVNRTLAASPCTLGLAETACPNPLLVTYHNMYVRATLFANRDVEFVVTEQTFKLGGAVTIHEADLSMSFEVLSMYFRQLGRRKVAVCNDDGKVSVVIGKTDSETPAQFSKIRRVVKLNDVPRQYLVETFITIRSIECDFVHAMLRLRASRPDFF